MIKMTQEVLDDLDGQTFTDESKVWKVLRLIQLTQNFEVLELDIRGFNVSFLKPEINTMNGFVTHMRRVNAADTNCPVILDEDGYVMDGRHRIAKALLENHKVIKAVRFEKTPLPDYHKEDGK